MTNPISFSKLEQALLAEAGHVLDNLMIQNILGLAQFGVEAEPLQAAVNQASPSPTLFGGMVINDKFKLGAASKKELVGVRAELIQCVELAIRLTSQDFTVYDGIRTVKEQAAHVKAGTSQTMQSKHLSGLAVDLVPWVSGRPVWDWDKIYPIIQAVDAAATHLGYASNLRWGGAWDRRLSDFGGEPAAYKRECELYASRHPGKDFLDGPHVEWVD